MEVTPRTWPRGLGRWRPRTLAFRGIAAHQAQHLRHGVTKRQGRWQAETTDDGRTEGDGVRPRNRGRPLRNRSAGPTVDLSGTGDVVTLRRSKTNPAGERPEVRRLVGGCAVDVRRLDSQPADDTARAAAPPARGRVFCMFADERQPNCRTHRFTRMLRHALVVRPAADGSGRGPPRPRSILVHTAWPELRTVGEGFRTASDARSPAPRRRP